MFFCKKASHRQVNHLGIPKNQKKIEALRAEEERKENREEYKSAKG
jgi:hypothetical protein